jgi:hypothetical protein
MSFSPFWCLQFHLHDFVSTALYINLCLTPQRECIHPTMYFLVCYDDFQSGTKTYFLNFNVFQIVSRSNPTQPAQHMNIPDPDTPELLGFLNELKVNLDNSQCSGGSTLHNDVLMNINYWFSLCYAHPHLVRAFFLNG